MEDQTKKKILIVEDDKSLQNALVEMISQEGFDSESASDGEEALVKVRSYLPDLVLLENGYEVLEEIKKDEKLKAIPVLILTNLEEVDNVQKALDFGATTFMVKSDFSLKDVVEKIRAALK